MACLFLAGCGFIPIPGASDAALKEGVSDYDKGLDAIGEVRPVEYRYRSDNPLNLPSDETRVGVIAQELEKPFPEAVSIGRKGYRHVDPGPVLWGTVNAVQDLKEENEALRKRVEELEKKVESNP